VIQAIGLTSSTPRRNARPAVADLTFDIRPGEVTGLLGPAGSGKTTAVRLLLGMDQGRGATLVHGRPLHELPHPEREIGALVGDVPCHPRRSARSHLEMLCAAFGLPLSRAEDLLRLVGLDAVADEPLATYSLGMDRRLGFAVTLLTRPRALVLDDPVRGLPPREAAWVHDLVRRHAAAGGAVLLTGRDARALARTADRVLALEDGRLVADEAAEQFARTRMRPYVAVRSPYALRLAEVLADTGAEVVPAGGSRIAVFGSTSAAVGEAAYRHGILLYQLADRTTGDEGQDEGSRVPVPTAEPEEPPAHDDRPEAAPADEAPTPPDGDNAPKLAHRGRLRTGPARPFGYEWRRAFGVRTPWFGMAAALAGSAAGTLLMTRHGTPATDQLGLISGWSPELPLPAAAIGAGGLGALTYGQEFLYPALTPGYGPEPRHPRLLVAKLAVSTLLALVLAALAVVLDVALLRTGLTPGPAPDPLADPRALGAWGALTVGCAWAGVLAAAAFRTTALGIAAVLAVPLLAVPAVRALLGAHAGGELVDAGGALWSLVSGVPQSGNNALSGVLRVVAQPLVLALVLCLAALVGAYTASALRGRRRGRRPTPVPGSQSAQAAGKKG
jgi:ABC-type multidrug transport system ATPase subunit